MSPSPYKRKPRLKVNIARHEEGDVITVGRRRWIIRSIHRQDVHLEASDSDTRIEWRTTLDKLPAPTKGKS